MGVSILLFWNTIKESFKQFYEYSFKLVFIDLIWFSLSALVGFIGYGGLISGLWILLIIPAVFLGPFFLSGLDITNEVAQGKQIKIPQFLKGIKTNFKRGVKGFLLTAIVYIVIFVDFYYFYQKGIESTFMIIVFGILIYIVLFFSMIQLYFWGLLACRKEDSIMVILKHAVVFSLDNILFAFLWLILVVALTAIMVYFQIVIPAVFMGLIGLVIINGTRLTLERY